MSSDARSQIAPFLEGRGALNNTRWVVGHSIDLIGAALRPGETIMALAVAKEPRVAVILATDQRLLIIQKGGFGMALAQWRVDHLTGQDVASVAYDTIHMVRVRRGLFPSGGEIAIGGPSGLLTLKYVENADAQLLGDYLTSRIAEQQQLRDRLDDGIAEAASQPADAAAGVPELLRQLAQLRDEGTLTEAEFEAKKHQLLERL